MTEYEKETFQLAKERFQQAADYYGPIYRACADDLKFVSGRQWDESLNPNDGRIRLTVPLIQSFVRQIVNEMRQNKPSITVNPQSGGADQDKAELLEGIVRHIEIKSKADRAYERAGWFAVCTGLGYIMLDTDYISPNSFNQEVKIRAVEDPSRIYLDPNAQEIDGSDAEYGFIIEDMPKEVFKRKYPKSKYCESMASRFHTPIALWEGTDSIRVVRYFAKEYEDVTIYLIKSSKGDTFVSKVPAEKLFPQPGEVFETVSKRKSSEVRVDEYIMNGMEILEQTVWPGKCIPIIRVCGDRFFVDGKLVQQGAVRQAKDVQKQYNYFASVGTELIDMAPKSSFVGATGQFANNPEKWADANVINYGFLDYNPVDVNGQLVPPPQRISAMDSGLFGATSASRLASLEDLKMVFGVQDASLGRAGSEISGVALLARKEQSGVSNYHYYDNLISAVAHLGTMIVDIIPKIYDTERAIQIVKPNEETSQVIINSDDPRYDLSDAGEYAVTVSTGPAFGTRRQQAAESMMNLVGAYPESFKVIGDLMVQNMDWPGSKQIAQRLKATIPSDILASTGEDDVSKMAPKELVQKLQLKMSQQSQVMQKMQADLDESQTKLQILESKTALELAASDQKNEVEMLKIALEREKLQFEVVLKQQEYELNAVNLELQKQQLAIKASMAAHQINESSLKAEMKALDVPGEINIGGNALDNRL